MFKNQKEEKVSQDFANSNNIIGKGSTFTGNIDTYGNLRVEGRIIGNVRSKSKIAVGQSAYIEGNILAQVSEIEGEVKGSVEVTDMLILKPTCTISGDIIANKLVVEAGAKFEGQCKMGGAAKKVDFDTTAAGEENSKKTIPKATGTS